MSLKENDLYFDSVVAGLQERGMSWDEIEHFIDIYGLDFEETDIPAYIRNPQETQERREFGEFIKQLKKMERAFLQDFNRSARNRYSEDYPLGGSVEPYDIELEKELCHEK